MADIAALLAALQSLPQVCHCAPAFLVELGFLGVLRYDIVIIYSATMVHCYN
jgi:hypothetical protein